LNPYQNALFNHFIVAAHLWVDYFFPFSYAHENGLSLSGGTVVVGQGRQYIFILKKAKNKIK